MGNKCSGRRDDTHTEAESRRAIQKKPKEKKQMPISVTVEQVDSQRIDSIASSVQLDWEAEDQENQ